MTIVAPASPRPTAAKVIARHNNEELRILFCVGVGSLFLFKKKREKKEFNLHLGPTKPGTHAPSNCYVLRLLAFIVFSFCHLKF